jgi:adenylosuccinate lyase
VKRIDAKKKLKEKYSMIPRYSHPEMLALWGEENKYKTWIEVELLAAEGMEKVGLIPSGTAASIRAKASIDVERILQIEDEVKHDVIAFLTSLAEQVGEPARFLHRGMTSSDLLDTSLAVLLKQAGGLILKEIDGLLARLKERAYEFKLTPTIGRSHGIHAEPTTFGVKLASFYAEIQRRRIVVEAALKAVSVGKLAGAVGTYASLPPAVEAYVFEKLGLISETVPSQIVHRDRHAEFFSSLALLGCSLERIAVEIRHLQRTEVGEVEESFSKGQKGSSAMPHKKNPILCENLTGLARLLRSYSQAALENVPLWHERDISHSSVERVIAPDACTTCHFMLVRMQQVIAGLVVHPERMKENLDSSRGLVYSGTLLIALADKGIAREEAYRIVQRNALSCWQDRAGPDFLTRLKEDAEVRKFLTEGEIGALFDIEKHLHHVDTLFERAFRE